MNLTNSTITMTKKPPIYREGSQHIILAIQPSRVTHQSGTRLTRGGTTYKSRALRQWEAELADALLAHVPDEPYDGPIELSCEFHFEPSKKSDAGTWKITKPDTDNMIKTVKDVMTRMGFWKDDAQVCKETVSKEWTVDPGVWIRITPMEMKK